MPWCDYGRKAIMGSKHIDSICAKVSAGTGAMRRVKPFVLPTLKMLYNAIMQPYFDYCSPL